MTVLYNNYALLFIDIKILKRYVCSRGTSASHDETRVYQLTKISRPLCLQKIWLVSISTNQYFVTFVSRQKTELRLYCRFLE